MSIIDYLSSFNVEDFKKKYGTKLASLDVFFKQEWKEGEEYAKTNEVIVYDNYIKTLYSSLQDNNIGNNPLNSEGYWQKEDVDEMSLMRLITDEDIVNCFAVSAKIVADWCNGIYLVATPPIIELFECLVCLNIFDMATNNSGILTTSESIDAMSIGGEANELIKKYPLLNNPFGVRFLFLYGLLFNYNYRFYNVYRNGTYNY